MNLFNVVLSTVVCVIVFYSRPTREEVFTSLADMEELLVTEAHFLRNLESFIASQDEKVEFLKR